MQLQLTVQPKRNKKRTATTPPQKPQRNPHAQMLGECGLCLALDEDRIESKAGGVLTTATAMGMPLIERMRKAGMTFKILDE